jgi:hypothetical protein
MICPSYFSMLRVGSMPFETVYGISRRRIPHLQDGERAKIVPNFAIFGRPIENKKVELRCIDNAYPSPSQIGLHFSPSENSRIILSFASWDVRLPQMLDPALYEYCRSRRWSPLPWRPGLPGWRWCSSRGSAANRAAADSCGTRSRASWD